MAKSPKSSINPWEVVAYCKTVLRRALREFLDAFGLNRTTVITGLIYAAVLLWRYRTKGKPAMIEEAAAWKSYLTDAVPPTLIVAGAVTLLCIIKASALIYKEQAVMPQPIRVPALPNIAVTIIEAFIHPETSLCF